jgi:hypothetical protein
METGTAQPGAAGRILRRSTGLIVLYMLGSGVILHPVHATDTGSARVSPATGVPGVMRALPRTLPPSPCRNYRYCLRWAGGTVGAASQATVSNPLSGHRQVVLAQGKITQPGFAAWVNGTTASPDKDLDIQEVNEAGVGIRDQKLTACHALVAQTMPDLDGNSAVVRIAYIKLQCAP